MRPGRISGKVALLVGAGSGIGEAAAHLFAREGAAVAVADIRADAARAVAQAVQEAGGKAAAFAVDVTSDESVRGAVAAVVEHFGKLDILFDSAGGSLPEDGPVTEVDLAVWDRTMPVDVRGAILCARHAIPALIGSGGGAVVLMSSGAALRGSSRAHIYAAAKGAVNALTRSLAGTYAKHNIRVNAICAGRIDTPRVRNAYGIPGSRATLGDPFDAATIVQAYPFWLGKPEDIAQIALFLASDESRMITGAEIPANGGRSAY